MARVNVRSWRETYRGLMPDRVLDDPGFESARERFWTAILTEDRYRAGRAAVAERDGELIGIALAGPVEDPGSPWGTQLYVLYVVAAEHGTGVGAALLDEVVDPRESALLWVADPNPRAQAFYRKHGSRQTGSWRWRRACGTSGWCGARPRIPPRVSRAARRLDDGPSTVLIPVVRRRRPSHSVPPSARLGP